ncbi:MAG: phage portal protein, partial [Planctomycetota bacterium]
MKLIPLKPRRANGGYDSAATTRGNARRWRYADGLSADAAASPQIRRIQRQRARYVFANNSYASGIIQTLANDTVGIGPRLQLLTRDANLNRQVELDFSAWATEIGLPEKLRTMRMARCCDGESFALLMTNPARFHPVQLDLELIEADRVSSPMTAFNNDNEIDGIILDQYGNPSQYRVLKKHPGDGLTMLGLSDADYKVFPASSIIHSFRAIRPGQHRGISEIAPALEIFEMMRSYTHAVLLSAETAAAHSIFIYSDASPSEFEAKEPEAFDYINIEHGMAVTLPGGWKAGQIRPEQPATSYSEFIDKNLNHVARCLNMPFNIAAGNSSGYNYASGRLDHQTYYKSLRVDQAYIGSCILDRILQVWLLEYGLINGLIPLSGNRLPPHQWFWDGHEHVDPKKEADAQSIRLSNRTTTYAAEYAKVGKDWEEEFNQIAREQAKM